MIKLNINVTKIAKDKLFQGQKGTYLDCVLFENRDGIDDYGNNGFIAQEVSKAEREAGIKGPIIGNYKVVETNQRSQRNGEADKRPPRSHAQQYPQQHSKPTAPPSLGRTHDDDDDEIPF